ncbi:MAG: hydrogenase 3 maturation endopeptidase HyCI [Bacillota bacterium]|nr:hydrogenase 3 maturation endopeptidase HyCI [Bacillota bacterium]
MTFYEILNGKLRGFSKLAVLGAGSTLRADDAAGIFIVERLGKVFKPGEYENVRFYAGEIAPENFSGKIKSFNPTHLLIIDAADLGLEPGTLTEIDPVDVGGPTYCSHMLPLKVMIDYLRGETGAEVILLGIQYKDIGFDCPMTPEMRKSVDGICEALIRVIGEHFSTGN